MSLALLALGHSPATSPKPLASRLDAECHLVICLIAKEKKLPVRLLLHPTRGRRGAARARQLAMYMVHTSLGRSLAEVGQIFGRDRTTVSHACALIEDKRDERQFDTDLDRLALMIEAEIATLQETGHGAR